LAIARNRSGHQDGQVPEILGEWIVPERAGTGGRKDIADLQSPVCHTPVPNIYHRYFAIHVKHLIDHTIIANANPVKIFCTGKFVCIVKEPVRSPDSQYDQK
jgi:hypothetical protein